MALKIETFTNTGWRPGNNAGGATLFKALGHPLTARAARAFLVDMASRGPVAVYDPLREVEHFDSFYNLSACDIAGVYIQDLNDVGTEILGRRAEPVTSLASSSAATVLVAAFNADKLCQHVAHLVPAGARLVSFDDFRLPDEMLTRPGDYLDPLNFATNFAFLKEGNGHHTRVQSVNYWGTYGAPDPALWLCLFGDDGSELACWTEPLPAPGAVFAIDSADVAERFGLGAFTGSLFMHAVRIAGHDVVKYVVDTYSDGPADPSCEDGPKGGHLSGTHDANAWPADFYAGLPAPQDGERVRLLIQNSHPVTIPSGGVGINLMGSQDIVPVPDEIPPFAMKSVDVGALLPDARWPDQVEVRAGRYFVRPRYEVTAPDGRIRFGHMNVERTDLRPDPNIPALAETMGKGYILPLPVLPMAEYRTEILPTPMSTAQDNLPIALAIFDTDGTQVTRHFLGCIPRRQSVAIDLDSLLGEAAGASLKAGYGHMELQYDFRDGGSADGWLHALMRVSHRAGGHVAETTFGAHIYNTPLTYRGEPQSYTTRPPGLSTRLFLRLAGTGAETMCHLTYPASTPWHARSATRLAAFDRAGRELGSCDIAIPCGGSLLWRMEDLFDAEVVSRSAGGYVVIRDATCRLFGFHGVVGPDGAFSLDHTFGF